MSIKAFDSDLYYDTLPQFLDNCSLGRLAQTSQAMRTLVHEHTNWTQRAAVDGVTLQSRTWIERTIEQDADGHIRERSVLFGPVIFSSGANWEDYALAHSTETRAGHAYERGVLSGPSAVSLLTHTGSFSCFAAMFVATRSNQKSSHPILELTVPMIGFLVLSMVHWSIHEKDVEEMVYAPFLPLHLENRLMNGFSFFMGAIAYAWGGVCLYNQMPISAAFLFFNGAVFLQRGCGPQTLVDRCGQVTGTLNSVQVRAKAVAKRTMRTSACVRLTTTCVKIVRKLISASLATRMENAFHGFLSKPKPSRN